MRTILLHVATLATLIAAPIANAAERLRVPPVTILTNALDYDPVRYEAAFMIAEAWRDLGLTVEVEALAFPDLIDRVQNHQDFDAAILGWSGRADRLDPQFFLSLLDAHQMGLRGNNITGYDNSDYDALFHAQSRAFDPAERKTLVNDAQRIATRDVPMAVLMHRDTVAAHSTTSFDNLVAVPSDGLYNEWNMMQARPLGDRTRLHVGGHQRTDGLNPLASTTSWSWRWMRFYYDYLVRLAPGAEPKLWAADTIEITGDRSLEVTLRPGLTFHDGMPVTAEDVAFSFSHPREAGFIYFDAYLDALETIEVVDALTVRFTLKYPSASFVTNALSQIAILPRHLWRDISDPSALAPESVPVIGSGPFHFTSNISGSSMSLNRFDSHFAAHDIAGSGVDFLFYDDAKAVLSALLAGEIDITAGTLDPWLIPEVEANDGVDLMATADVGFNHISFNTRRHAFAEPGFRRALTHAIDRSRIIDVLLEGRAMAGASMIAPVNSFWHNPDVEALTFDMNAAITALKTSGFDWDDAGNLLLPMPLD